MVTRALHCGDECCCRAVRIESSVDLAGVLHVQDTGPYGCLPLFEQLCGECLCCRGGAT
nr:hypothetical protein [Saccharopolyspora soli]